MNADLGVVKQQQQQGQIASTAGPAQMKPVVADANVAAMHSPQPLMQSMLTLARFGFFVDVGLCIDWNPMGFGMRGFMPQTPMQQQQQQQVSASRFSDRTSSLSYL